MLALENPNTLVFLVATYTISRTVGSIKDFLRSEGIKYSIKNNDFVLENNSRLRIVRNRDGISSNSIIGE
jgi:hypothetical protein